MKISWFKTSRLSLFFTAAILIWLQTYFVQRFYFDLPIDDFFQEFILFINPMSSTLMLLAVFVLFARKRRHFWVIVATAISSLLLLSNVVYYRFYHDFMTMPVMMQTKNVGDLGSSIESLLSIYDIFIFTDVFVLIYLVYFRKFRNIELKRFDIRKMVLSSLILFLVNLSLANIARPDLLTRTFDRQILVRSIGTINYHLYDIYLNSKTKTQKVFANSGDMEEVEQYMSSRTQVSKSPYFGAAKGKNVVFVALESTQTFVLEEKLFGQEITPFLNRLIKDSFYFDNVYHQTGQGKTSDAEFIIENSLYPLPAGAVFFTHSGNEFNGTPKLLKEYGYSSAVFHANDRSFWNRDLMYQTLGYDKYFAKESYEVTDENSIGWGLKDKDFFRQSMPYLKEMKQPFYTKFLTLTNHFPFSLEKVDETIPEYTSGDGTVDRYFTTVRYMDESIEVFFDEMKKAGLYENSIFILYGDHYGISATHNDAMGEFLNREITPYEQTQLQRIPLIIHIPGMEGKRISTVGGQIDIRPTLMHLLGLTDSDSLDFGHDLLSSDHENFVVMRDGSLVTDELVYASGVCYRKGYYGVETDQSECDPYIEKADAELSHSDKIIYGDLLRFFIANEPKKN